MITEQRCYFVKDIQQMLGLSRQAVYDLMRRKEFHWVVVGGKYCVSKKSFDRWLDGDTEREEQAGVLS